MIRVLNTVKLLSVTGLLLVAAQPSFGRDNIGKAPVEERPKPVIDIRMKAASCAPSTAQRDLDVNNVRTTILNGGDLWWNLSNARYEVPKVQPGQVSKHSLFSGALWIGGVTNGNLRIAAQTYRQSGNDYYPGPLTVGTASISEARCKYFDRIWKITLTEIDNFRKNPTNWANPSDEIASWPCIGNVAEGESKYLAPFVDYDGDGEWDPNAGDYPSFDQNNADNIPDMMLFILTNDKGNIHSETQGLPIGLELHTQAFAYSTNDEVNNMTFYRTTIFNRGSETIDSCVFGQWVDPDLGNYNDDYVECDVPRNLGICYNGDDNDEGILGYGLNPPSIGVNFFEGPRRPDGSEIGLTKFVYYNNDFSPTGNPSRPEHYWGYLNGKWKDGTSITYGGNGKGGADTASFMFPGSTDPAGRPAWNERNSQNQPSDRRFLQTAGSFSLLPGAVNRVTIGVVWARASSGGATGSFNLLKEASDKAYTLYKNNFKLIAGPDAPVLSITELDRRLIVTLNQTNSIENFTDSFAGSCSNFTTFKFQGYQIFQLKTNSLPSDLYDQDQARLVAQFDIVDGTARLVNTIFSPELEENVKKIMVNGSDGGIKHSFQISTDLFETGADQELVNFRNYHYVILAYASATNCASDQTQYLPGRKTIGRNELTIYTATPHSRSFDNNGTQVNSQFGDGLAVTQIEGIGNGGMAVELSTETINEIMTSSKHYAKYRKYVPGYGPIGVKVIDPLKLPDGDFILYMRDTATVNSNKDSMLNPATTQWYLKFNGIVKKGEASLSKPNEQLFPEWGISVDLSQSLMPGDINNANDQSNGYITSSITWSNVTQQWLSNIIDEDPRYSTFVYGFSGGPLTLAPQFNWIRAGNFGTPDFNNFEIHDFALNKVPMDIRKNFAKVVNGTWSPYALVSRWKTNSTVKFPTYGPGWDINNNGGPASDNTLADQHSVKVVFTANKALWTRCVVLEAGENANFNIGKAYKMDYRRSPSVDKNGIPTGKPGCNESEAQLVSSIGMGWFPGYAIDMETGERLNMMFAEDSSLPSENGGDMIWNPTSTILNSGAQPQFGGKHYVYVMGAKKYQLSSIKYQGPRYDMGANYRNRLDSNATGAGVPSSLTVRRRQVFSQAMWVTMPVLANGFKLLSPQQGLIPSTVTVDIKVKRPYANFSVDGNTINDSMPYFSFSTKGFAPTVSEEVGKKALDKVNIVPNPYYAYSSYEDPGNQLSNEVRLVNLPARCEIRIFTLDGVLVRTIRKDDPNTPYTPWDLKNDAKVPISSGTYIIHIKATDFGEERIIKWFGVMRPVDYDTF